MPAHILPEEFRVLSQFIRSISGIYLDDSKAYLIENRLSGLLAELHCANFSELYFKAKADPGRSLQRRIIDLITTGETSFFRDTAPFDLLRHKLLPDLIDRRTRAANGKAPISLRIWSAACSTGQEVYTIAIVLKELLGDPGKYTIRLLGTDLSDKAVAAASRGEYNKVEIERGLPADKLSRYFTPTAIGWKSARRASCPGHLQNRQPDGGSEWPGQIRHCLLPQRGHLFHRTGPGGGVPPHRPGPGTGWEPDHRLHRIHGRDLPGLSVADLPAGRLLSSESCCLGEKH